MFNYHEVDKYITLEHLSLIMKWFEEVDSKTSNRYMVTSVERNGNEYIFHLSSVQNGHMHKFKIEDGKVIDLGKDNFWVS